MPNPRGKCVGISESRNRPTCQNVGIHQQPRTTRNLWVKGGPYQVSVIQYLGNVGTNRKLSSTDHLKKQIGARGFRRSLQRGKGYCHILKESVGTSRNPQNPNPHPQSPSPQGKASAKTLFATTDHQTSFGDRRDPTRIQHPWGADAKAKAWWWQAVILQPQTT